MQVPPVLSVALAVSLGLGSCASPVRLNHRPVGFWAAAERGRLPTAATASPAHQEPRPPQEPAPAQGDPAPARGRGERTARAPAPHLSLDLFGGYGLSLGNSRDWTGLRINFRDRGAGHLRGVNLTLWAPADHAVERIDGLALGVAPVADHLRGVALGALASVTEDASEGIGLAGLAVVSSGNLSGIHAAGLAAVAERDMDGLQLAGLAVVSEGNVSGLSAGGVAMVAEGDATGVQLGGLATVTEGAMSGVNLAGLAAVAEGSISGITASGLAAVAEDELDGVAGAGLAAIGSQHVTGVAIAGLHVGDGGEELFDLNLTGALENPSTSACGILVAGFGVQAGTIEGLSIAGIFNRAEDFTGVGLSACNAVSGTQTGLTVGIFNHAEDLRGVQIGLLNHVPSNPWWARWLPLVNVRT
ncbi:MAG: hypothetical protein AAF628_37815 [Planctomycetota bacterium]